MASPALIPASELSEEEFERRTLEAIRRELGPGGVARFIMTFRSGTGDYTRDRRLWQKDMTVAEVVADLEAKYGPSSHNSWSDGTKGSESDRVAAAMVIPQTKVPKATAKAERRGSS